MHLIITLEKKVKLLSGVVGWARIHTTKSGLGLIPGRVIPKTGKTAVAVCPTSCSALMGGCKESVHARYCNSPPALTAEAAWYTNFDRLATGKSADDVNFFPAKTHIKQCYCRSCPCKVNVTVAYTMEWVAQVTFSFWDPEIRDKFRCSNCTCFTKM